MRERVCILIFQSIYFLYKCLFAIFIQFLLFFFFFLVYNRVMNSASNYVAVENYQEMNDNSRD